MVRLLHVSDLHLSADPDERDYALDVLDEIVGLAGPQGCAADVILFAGHLFDPAAIEGTADPAAGGSAEDLDEALVTGASAAVDRLPCPAVALAAPGEPVALLAAAGVHVVQNDDRMGDLLGDGSLEVLAITPGRRRGSVPARSARHRIAAAHAPWPEAEIRGAWVLGDGAGAAFDPADIAALDADYLALGSSHHLVPPFRCGSTLVGDPGAARITARGEPGPRSVLLVELGVRATAERIVLERAGQNRIVDAWVRPDGALADPGVLRAVRGHDALELRLHGWLGGLEPAVVQRSLTEHLQGRLRRLRVDTSAVVTVRDRAGEALCGHLTALCRARAGSGPEADADPVWIRAADRALAALTAQEVL